MGWSWDCGKEGWMSLGGTIRERGPVKAAGIFDDTQSCPHSCLLGCWCPAESEAVLPLVIPQNHVRGQRSSLGQSECFSVLPAISKCFQIFSLIFSLQWFKSHIILNKSLAPNWQADSERGGWAFGYSALQ